MGKRLLTIFSSLIICFLISGAAGKKTPENKITLTTAVSPAGAGQISPDQGVYNQGTNVILTARALEGWQFDHWSGTDNDNANPTSVTMSANKQVMAFFIRKVNDQTPEKSQQPTENRSETPPEKIITVAIYPVKVMGADKSLSPILSSFLVSDLGQSPRLKVVEEEMIGEVLKKLNYANSDFCDNTQCQLSVGKLTPAQKILITNLSKLGEKFVINGRVVDIEKGTVDFPFKEERVCKEEDLDKLVELAAWDIREKFGEKVERPNPVAAVPAASVRPSKNTPSSRIPLRNSG